jgi:glycosyltransferase involved in cell wall biosynthesis
MKVLWFANTPASGGEFIGDNNVRGGWLKSLDKLLSKHVELHVAFEYPKLLSDFVYKGIYYHPITLSSSSSNFLLLKKHFFNEFIDDQHKKQYISLIEEVKPNVIHIHGTENPFSVILKYELNIPVVLSIQGNCTVYHYKYFDGLPKSLSKKKNFSTIKSLVLQKSYKSIYNDSKRRSLREQKYIRLHKNIIGRTDWDRRISLILSPERKYFHNNEVLRDGFYQAEWKFNEQLDEVIIHSTIGSNYFKGLEVIMLCSNLLNLNGVKHKWRIAGISKDDLIVKIAKRHLGINNIDETLIYLRNLDEHKLVESLLESHLYVMPSHIENSPNNLCEALILGMPCIATHAGGSSSLITDKEDGVLVQTGDPWSMAGAIVEYINDFEKAINYGKKARDRALKRHDKVKIVTELLEIYNSIRHE